MENSEVLVSTLESIIDQLVIILPKLIIALLIWYIGRYLISVGSNLIKKIDVKKTKVEDKAVTMMSSLLEIVGRIVLILVILDFLGIGRTIIAAFTQGVTFAIAIALGLSFGKALEPEATKVVQNLRKLFKE